MTASAASGCCTWAIARAGFYDRIVNALLELKQDTSTVGYAYL